MRLFSGGAKAVVDAASLPRWPAYYHALRAGKTPDTLKPAQCEVNEEINSKIVLWRGDITSLKIGGIVNAANSELWAGGGICGAIHKAAGPRLEQACEKLSPCPTGQTVITPGFKLPADCVLHSVGPTNGSPAALESCYRTIMECCVKNKVRSVCMCCISTGIFGFPNEPACMIALSTVRQFLEVPENAAAIDLVVFCTFLIEDVKLYDQYTPVWFPVERSAAATLASVDATPASVDVTPASADAAPTSAVATLVSADATPVSAAATTVSAEATPASDVGGAEQKTGAKRTASSTASTGNVIEPELKSPKVVLDEPISVATPSKTTIESVAPLSSTEPAPEANTAPNSEQHSL